MPKGNPNPVRKFTSEYQPKNKRRPTAALTMELRRRLKSRADGTKWAKRLIGIMLKELENVESGKTPMSQVHTKIIDMLWDRSEGPVKQETDLNVQVEGAIVLIPLDLDTALKQRELMGQQKQLESGDAEDDDAVRRA